ncbi:titin homolog [Nematostella vectensis]|uniref:titin homolog n=1 Tax=Nematostella vectensis TaxID=45351 RepID=UPI0020775E3D|nr:titin homolog [Nematostella vectensis]
MTVSLTDLLDMAISPEIGPVNFFHLRNLLHTLLEHFDIGEIEAQQAEIVAPGGYESSEESESGSENSDSETENESEQSEPEIEIVGEEVQKTIIDEDGQEKTVTVTIQKKVIKEKDPSEKKKDGESKKKHRSEKAKDGSDGKERSDRKEKRKDRKTKSDKDGDEGMSGKKSDKSAVYGSSAYGKDSYGSKSKKVEKKVTSETIGELPEIINLERRIEAAEVGIKSLRNIIDSMVNQVDFGDGVGDMLKAQLDQVQQQMNEVELIKKEEPKDKKKNKGFKSKESQNVPQTGIITEGDSGALGATTASAPGAPVAPASAIAAVIPPPNRRAQDTGKRVPSRKDSRKGGVQLKGARPPSQEGEKPALLKKRTTLRDLQLRKMAREEGVSIEEIEAREEAAGGDEEQKEKMKERKDKKEEKKDKDKDKDKDEEDDSSDSEEEREAMDEMIMEEIEAALENAGDDPEAQAYALRLGLEQMQNMKKTLSMQQEDFKKDMEKNKKAIDQLSRELSLFRAARKAQDAEGFNAVHHVHSMVLELQTKHDKMMATTAELVNEYNRREKVLDELADSIDKLEQKKADKQDVNKNIDIKANKEDLESKVSMNQFDESFNLLDRGLNEALEKMGNQMTIEDALKETLMDLQSKLTLKLDRNELDNLRAQLESRIKEVQVTRTVIQVKPEDGEPAGFRRNITEKVHCISCDRLLDVQTSVAPPPLPKNQPLPSHKSAKPYTTYELEHIRQHQKMNVGLRKAVIGADLPYSAQKLRNEVVAMTGMDLIDLPPSQRYCGGSHTIIHPLRRNVKSNSHFNQYVVIKDDAEAPVALPKREFIVPKDSGLKKHSKPKLPSIRQGMSDDVPPMEYEYEERPASAPATPSLLSNHNNYNNYPQGKVRRSMSSPQGGPPLSPPPGRTGEGSPVELGRISVTVPSPDVES